MCEVVLIVLAFLGGLALGLGCSPFVFGSKPVKGKKAKPGPKPKSGGGPGEGGEGP